MVKFTAHNSPMVCAAQIWSTKLHHWANRWLTCCDFKGGYRCPANDCYHVLSAGLFLPVDGLVRQCAELLDVLCTVFGSILIDGIAGQYRWKNRNTSTNRPSPTCQSSRRASRPERWDAIVCEPCREAAQVHELEAMKSHVELAAGHLLQALKCAAKLAESQPTAPNTARQEILLCAWRSLCGYQEDIRCISTGSCNWQRKTSAVA